MGRHYADLLHDQQRLVAEVRAMQERSHGRAALRRKEGKLFWEYTVREHGRSLPVEIRYPAEYPANPPEIISMIDLPPTPHQLEDNKLCWIEWYSRTCPWNPARDTAAVCISAAHWWFACFLIHQTRGVWPTDKRTMG